MPPSARRLCPTAIALAGVQDPGIENPLPKNAQNVYTVKSKWADGHDGCTPSVHPFLVVSWLDACDTWIGIKGGNAYGSGWDEFRLHQSPRRGGGGPVQAVRETVLQRL
ncbi:MAG: hypothetical protein AMXMBFR82_22570 [Candidatus Hydrogenedentota bacterium]